MTARHAPLHHRPPAARRWLLAWLSVVLVTVSGCASAARPATAPDRARALEALRADLSRIFLAPAFDHAAWGVLVRSLTTGETLYELNATKLMMPASNMKVVTMAVSAARLGWDHRFETRLIAAGPVEDGTLRGDLVVVGSGDPSISAGAGDPARRLAAWADELRAAGITAIDGRIVGDDNRFDDERFGYGWAWDDLPYGYAAPVGALQYNEDLVDLTLTPGSRAGEPVSIVAAPPDHGLTLLNRLVTAPPGTVPRISLARLPGATTLAIDGALPAGSEPVRRTASVDNPTAFLVRSLRTALIAQGISVRGDAVDIDDLAPEEESWQGTNGAAPRVIATLLSPPLSDIGAVLMKTSQNLYAETLLRVLGSGDGPGSSDAGRQIVADTLKSWGIPDSQFVVADGSGLSRNNYLTASLLVGVLTHMRKNPTLSAPFEATLPIAGVDGTLAGRMRATRAEGVARAKTGTIANVRTLSGYLTTRDGEPLVFSILANHFNVAGQRILDEIDRAVERLATFSRRPSP